MLKERESVTSCLARDTFQKEPSRSQLIRSAVSQTSSQFLEPSSPPRHAKNQSLYSDTVRMDRCGYIAASDRSECILCNNSRRRTNDHSRLRVDSISSNVSVILCPISSECWVNTSFKDSISLHTSSL